MDRVLKSSPLSMLTNSLWSQCLFFLSLTGVSYCLANQHLSSATVQAAASSPQLSFDRSHGGNKRTLKLRLFTSSPRRCLWGCCMERHLHGIMLTSQLWGFLSHNPRGTCNGELVRYSTAPSTELIVREMGQWQSLIELSARKVVLAAC